MPQAISIDNFIEQHRNDQRIAFCGKLAIAKTILDAEGVSSLQRERERAHRGLDLQSIAATWFTSFFQLLTEGCAESDLAERFEKISVVCFNYDRCLEYFLIHALQNYYRLEAQRSADLVRSIEILHPYGIVGQLPLLASANTCEYGIEISAERLRAVAPSIRTFTEGMNPERGDLSAIRRVIGEARRLVFLGFAFHPMNLDLLFSDDQPPSRTEAPEAIFGSALHMSGPDCRTIIDELHTRSGFPRDQIYLSNTTCAGLFKEYWRSLSLR